MTVTSSQIVQMWHVTSFFHIERSEYISRIWCSSRKLSLKSFFAVSFVYRSFCSRNVEKLYTIHVFKVYNVSIMCSWIMSWQRIFVQTLSPTLDHGLRVPRIMAGNSNLRCFFGIFWSHRFFLMCQECISNCIKNVIKLIPEIKRIVETIWQKLL